MSRSINEYTQFAHQFNYVGVGVTRGLHSSTAAIYSGSATYDKHGRNIYQGSPATSIIKYDGGSKQYLLQNIPDIFIPIGIGIGTVGIRSETQIIINTESTENPNVQVGDIVNFDATSGSLSDQRSRVVGVGTFYFIIEDNIDSIGSIGANGNCNVKKLETFIPTGANAGIGATGNYRGAICLNDNNSNSGDFDDFVLRCHSANISGSGSGASVVGFNYENGGAFYGPPVTDVEEQSGDNGYIFNDDGVRGNFPNASGGIGSGANWKRLKNTYYKYSAPVYSTRYINGAGNGAEEPACQSGRFRFNPFGSRMIIRVNLTDADGNNNQDFFFNQVGRQIQSPPGVFPSRWNVKVTCPTRYSPIGIYSSERPYVWCSINSRSTNGSTSNTSDPAAPGGNSTYITYDLQILASNVNLDTEGGSITVGVGSPSAFDFGGLTNSEPCILEWFKTGGTGSITKEVNFHASVDAGFNNNFMLQTQRIVDNNWVFDSGTASDVFKLKKVFEKNSMIHGSGNKKFNNFSREMMPNLEYRVWNDAQNTARPYFKIINHPNSDQADE